MLETRVLYNHQGEKAMRVDLLQALRQLLKILTTAAAIAETVQGAVGSPSRGQRAADAQLSRILPDTGEPAPAPSSPGTVAPQGQPLPPMPSAPPPPPQPGQTVGPGETVTR